MIQELACFSSTAQLTKKNIRLAKQAVVLALLSLTFFLITSAKAELAEHIKMAVENPNRPKSDIARDPSRKPAEILSFYDVKPGDHVLDLFSGGGYYTEILSYAVGATGQVIAHNNQAYLEYVGKEVVFRGYQQRLNNVTPLVSEANQLTLKANSLDKVFFILSYHDIYFVDEKWPKIDAHILLKHLFKALKPGGIVALVDHQAKAGTPTSSGHSLHRIAPEHVLSAFKQAGFSLAARSDLLINPNDDLTSVAVAPDVRGKTSRFVLKFIKPQND